MAKYVTQMSKNDEEPYQILDKTARQQISEEVTAREAAVAAETAARAAETSVIPTIQTGVANNATAIGDLRNAMNFNFDTLYLPTELARKTNVFEGTQYHERRNTSNGNNLLCDYGGYSVLRLNGTCIRNNQVWVSDSKLNMIGGEKYTLLAYTANGIPMSLYIHGATSNGANVQVLVNGNATVVRPDNDVTNQYINLWFIGESSDAPVDVTGDYLLLICHGEYTKDQLIHSVNDDITKAKSDLVYNLDSYKLVTDRVRQNNIFEGTQYDKRNNAGLDIEKVEYSGVKLTGHIPANTVMWFSKAALNLTANQPYTMWVEQDFNNHYVMISFNLAHQNNSIINFHCNRTEPLVFVPDADVANDYLRIYAGGTEYPDGLTIDTTIHIYIVEGIYGISEFNFMKTGGNDINIDLPDSYLAVTDKIRDANMFHGTQYENVIGVNDLFVEKEGYSGVRLTGTIRANQIDYITRRSFTLESGKYYTYCVKTTGNNNISFSISGLKEGASIPSIVTQDGVNVSTRIKNRAYTFTPDETMTNCYFNAYGFADSDLILDGDVYYIYLVEGQYGTEAFMRPDRADAGQYRETHVFSNQYQTGLPALYISGDVSKATKDTKVDITYRYVGIDMDVSGTGNIKWQGASSLSYPKKNYTINKLNPKMEFGNWGARNKFVLKANFIDNSHARNICCAKLWGEIVKSREIPDEHLVSLPNGGAIDGFPVMVFINDAYHGLYTLTTSKDENLLAMGEEATEFIFSAEAHSQPTRFRDTFTLAEAVAETNFGIEYAPDEENMQWAVDSLNDLITACINAHDAEAYSALNAKIDIDSAIDYLLFTALIGGTDLWDKNYLLGTYDGTKWFFSAYDLDTTFGNHWTGTSYNDVRVSPTYTSLTNYNTGHRLFYLIDHYDRARVKARFAELINGPMSEINVLKICSNFLCNIPSALKVKDSELWPMLPGTETSNLTQITDWYRLRLAYIKSEIENL